MGQYAHGNQPIQHMPYLYTYAGQPWKTQFHVRNIMNRLYTPGPDGLCGDEDNGQTSAWFVFSALGFYPVTSGSGQYVLGSPLFPRVTLYLENGRRFIVEAPGNTDDSLYIQAAELNGKEYGKNVLDHETVMKGGRLVLKMGNMPNRKRALGPLERPYSMSGK